MSERKDERWLDDQLRRAVHASTPAFDAESWKRGHQGQYDSLLARKERPDSRKVRLLRGWWIAGAAVAAAILLAAGTLFLDQSADAPAEPPAPTSSAEIMSMMSLRMAYEQGGFDELDRQLQNTLDEFGPRSSGVSLQELF